MMAGLGLRARPLATLAVALALMLAATAALAREHSDSCEAELTGLARGLPEDMPIGTFAAQMFHGAVELVEPVLPPLSYGGRVPLESDEAGYLAVDWLLGRDLLPDGWSHLEMSTAEWTEMLSRFEGWYGIGQSHEPESAGTAPLDRQEVLESLIATLDRIAGAVRPVAILATGEDGTVEFAAILWNWSAYPRLIVRRPGITTLIGDGPQEVLAELGNCAVRLEDWVTAPVETAWRLFTGTGDAVMYVMESDPDRVSWPLEVQQDDVLEYLFFDAEDVRGTHSFSAIFSGQELGLNEIMSLVFQVRTNVPVTRIPSVLAVPRR